MVDVDVFCDITAAEAECLLGDARLLVGLPTNHQVTCGQLSHPEQI